MFKKNIYKEALEKFAGSYVLEKVSNGGDEFLNINGEVLPLVIQTMSIKNIAKANEGKSPQEIIEFINFYYMQIFDCIHRNNGIVNDIINDTIISIWGLNPSYYKTKEYDSCTSANESQEIFNNLLEKTNYGSIELINGIASGEVLIGNFGSKDRLFNVVMGDYVRLSFMLMEKNNYYNTNILISEVVNNKVNNEIETKEVDAINITQTVQNKIYTIKKNN